MASKGRQKGPEPRTDEYLHAGPKRTNNPDAGLHSADNVKVPPRVKYQYDPHLDPQLVWASKAERSEIEVETVSLHRHEVVRPQDIVAMVQGEQVQGSLFGDQRLPIHKAVEFYKHEQPWMNRLVLGDSLLVMNSLLHSEKLGGQVQMIYIDPPYGIAYNSNFQPRIDKREVQDGKDDSLSREPEQIKAYRDTWALGVHSYLSYLRDRLTLARELLSERGSVFVQISDDNVHHVRELLDEVFGKGNFASLITFQKTTGSTTATVPTTSDYLLWYAKNLKTIKFRKLYERQVPGTAGALEYKRVELADGMLSPVSKYIIDGRTALPKGARLFSTGDISSKGGDDPDIVVKWEGKKITLSCKPNRHWKCGVEGTKRLWEAGRLLRQRGLRIYKRYFDDFPYRELTHVWTDTRGEDDPQYVVQTATKVVARCILMTTDPGDLVLDSTCGSGTTAYVAEHWGRRWITCDTSRVAIALARQRLMTAVFPFYQLAYPQEGVAGGLKYVEVPHITASSIAHNLTPEMERLFDVPIERDQVSRVAGPFTVEAIASLDPSESMTAAPSVTDVVPLRSADRVQQLFDVLAKDGGLNVPGKGRIEITALHRVMDLNGIDAEGDIAPGGKKLRLAVAFGPYHGPVTANRLEDALKAAKGNGYGALAVAGFSFDPEVSAYLDKNPKLGIELFRVQIAPDVQIGDLLKVRHAEKLFSVLGQADFEVAKQGQQFLVHLLGIDLYDPNQRIVKPHELDGVAAWFLDTDYDGRCFRVRQVFLPAEKGKGFDKLQRSLKAIVDEDAWDALKGFTSLPFDLGSQKTVAVKVIDIYGHEVVGVRKVKA